MMRVALTGGIGTGKSHCAGRFRALGVAVIDADGLAHAAVAAGTPGLAAVAARFGDQFILSSGELDRAALGRLVFGDADARRDLEKIIHPIVYGEIGRWFAGLEQRETRPRLGIAEIPLLYETGHEADFDRVIVAACTPEAQRRRLLDRGLSAVDAEQRIASQLALADKSRRADYVIETSGSFDETDRQVAQIARDLARSGR